MTKRYVFNEIVTQVSENLKNEGFEYQKSNGRILRVYPEGFDVIIFKIVDYWPVFEIETFLGIRINKVEDIVNLFLKYSFASPKYMKYTETIGTSYMVLSGAKENCIKFETEEDFNKAIKELIILIKNKGLDYFKKHRHVETANTLKKTQILSEDNGINYVIGNLMQSLTLMKLCNDPDFEKLRVKYKELYVPFVGEEESGRKAMDDLIEYLKELN